MGSNLLAEECPKTSLDMEDTTYVPYANEVGSLMYAMIYTRPDISQEVRLLSRFMANPRHEQWVALKRVFRYL